MVPIWFLFRRRWHRLSSHIFFSALLVTLDPEEAWSVLAYVSWTILSPIPLQNRWESLSRMPNIDALPDGQGRSTPQGAGRWTLRTAHCRVTSSSTRQKHVNKDRALNLVQSTVLALKVVQGAACRLQCVSSRTWSRIVWATHQTHIHHSYIGAIVSGDT
jgi:hypothetical protein